MWLVCFVLMLATVSPYSANNPPFSEFLGSWQYCIVGSVHSICVTSARKEEEGFRHLLGWLMLTLPWLRADCLAAAMREEWWSSGTVHLHPIHPFGTFCKPIVKWIILALGLRLYRAVLPGPWNCSRTVWNLQWMCLVTSVAYNDKSFCNNS